MSKYTVKIKLNEILENEISNHDKAKESPKDQLPYYEYYDDLKESNSLTDIMGQLNDRYRVDENPVRNLPILCYNISQKEEDRITFGTTKIAMGKGNKQTLTVFCSNL